MSRWRWIAVSMGLVCASVTAGRETENVPVPPGGVVRWPAEDAAVCRLDDLRFEPVQGACWFAVDLLRGEGPLQLAVELGGRTETRTVRVAPYPYPEQHLTVEPGTVDLAPDDLVRAERERERVERLWSLDTPRRFRLPLGAPLSPMSAGGNFGRRRVLNGQPRSPHTGIDLSAARGTPVLAVANGTVVLAEEHFFAGNSVFVDHGDGLVTMYFHLHELAVAAGDTVKRGDRVGTVGSSGRSTGPHLHFGARWRGARIDPVTLLDPDHETVLLTP